MRRRDVLSGGGARRGLAAIAGLTLLGWAGLAAAQLRGEIAFASMSLAQVVGPVSRGADLVVIASLVDRLACRLVATPQIRDPTNWPSGTALATARR